MLRVTHVKPNKEYVISNYEFRLLHVYIHTHINGWGQFRAENIIFSNSQTAELLKCEQI